MNQAKTWNSKVTWSNSLPRFKKLYVQIIYCLTAGSLVTYASILMILVFLTLKKFETVTASLGSLASSSDVSEFL